MKLIIIVASVFLLCTSLFARRVEECGVESYNQQSAPICGVSLYANKRSNQCSPELYLAKADKKICGTERVITGYKILDCPDAGKNCDPTKPIPIYTTQAKTCRHPSFGVEQYAMCRHESHGVEEYKTCQNPSFGVNQYKDCNIFMTRAEINEYLFTLDMILEEMRLRYDLSKVQTLKYGNSAKALACFIEEKREIDPDLAMELEMQFIIFSGGMNFEDVDTSDCTSAYTDVLSKTCAATDKSTFCRYKTILDQTEKQLKDHAIKLDRIIKDIVAKQDATLRARLTEYQQNITNIMK